MVSFERFFDSNDLYKKNINLAKTISKGGRDWYWKENQDWF